MRKLLRDNGLVPVLRHDLPAGTVRGGVAGSTPTSTTTRSPRGRSRLARASTSPRPTSRRTSRRTGSRSTCSSSSTSFAPCGWCSGDRRSRSRSTRQGRSRTRTSGRRRTPRPDSPTLGPRAAAARTWLYSNSLGLVMGAIFVGRGLAQSVAGRAAYNAEQLAHLQDPCRWVGVPRCRRTSGTARCRTGSRSSSRSRSMVRAVDLPAPARFTRVEAGGHGARSDRHRGLTTAPGAIRWSRPSRDGSARIFREQEPTGEPEEREGKGRSREQHAQRPSLAPGVPGL